MAEGVETEDQLKALRDDGCDLAQGYVFARPSTGADLQALVASEASW